MLFQHKPGIEHATTTNKQIMKNNMSTPIAFSYTSPLPSSFKSCSLSPSFLCPVTTISITTTTKRPNFIYCSSSSPPPPKSSSSSSDNSFLDRIRSINRVSDTPSLDQVSYLLSLITDDPNPQVRYAAISRLSNVDSQALNLSTTDTSRVLNAARHALTTDTEASCRAAAADLIAGMKLVEGFEDLVTTFHTTKDWVLKFSIAAGVGEMKHPGSYQFLTDVLQQFVQVDNQPKETEDNMDDVLLITACVGALGDLGDKRAAGLIDKFTQHKDSSVRERAKISSETLAKL